MLEKAGNWRLEESTGEKNGDPGGGKEKQLSGIRPGISTNHGELLELETILYTKEDGICASC